MEGSAVLLLLPRQWFLFRLFGPFRTGLCQRRCPEQPAGHGEGGANDKVQFQLKYQENDHAEKQNPAP